MCERQSEVSLLNSARKQTDPIGGLGAALAWMMHLTMGDRNAGGRCLLIERLSLPRWQGESQDHSTRRYWHLLLVALFCKDD